MDLTPAKLATSLVCIGVGYGVSSGGYDSEIEVVMEGKKGSC